MGDRMEEQVTEQLGGAGVAVRHGYLVRPAEGVDAGKAMHVTATSGQITVGTSPSCDFVVQDRSVSRRHVVFELDGTSLRVSDLDSTNGTFVNGTRVRDAYAVSGDAIRVGSTVLAVTATEDSGPRLPVRTSLGRIVGASAAMRRVYIVLERLAATNVPVVVEGEAGTGKELVAEVVHELGPRSVGPFVVFDASLASASDVEAQLFHPTDGAFARASGGSLLVDDVSRLPAAAQAQLVREMRTGAPDAPRVIATSRTSLDKAVEAGTFREELFFELVVGRIELPPLRARGDDVRLLAEYFWKKLDGSGRSLPPDLLRRTEGHSWPGNVRELASRVARRLALGDASDDADATRPDGAPQNAFRWLLDQVDDGLAFPVARTLLLAEFEKVFVAHALAKSNGNVSRAAAMSGLARRYFQIMRARVDPTKP